MRTIAILAQEGGVGKTTLATCLAVEAERRSNLTALLDLDPQATASFWHDVREKEEPAVTAIPSVRLAAAQTAAAEAGCQYLFIDGAAVARDITHEAAKLADYVLIPFKSAVFDINSVMSTIETVRATETPFSLVMTFVPPVGREIIEAQEIAKTLDAPLAPVTIGHRKAYYRAQEAGLAVQEYDPADKAADEIIALYDYLESELAAQEGGHHGKRTASRA